MNSTDSNRKPIRTELLAHSALFTQQIPAIQKLLLNLERKGRSPRTVRFYEQCLKGLAKRCDLQDPDCTALEIARYKLPNGRSATNSYKAKLATSYAYYCKINKIEWEKAVYHPEEQGIIPPNDEQVKMLISGIKGALSIKVQVIAETGLRPIEIQGEKGLQVKSIHLDQKSITALSTKNCNARPPMKITDELTVRLKTYITKHNLQTEDLLFLGAAERFGESYRRARNQLACKLSKPELKNIRLYDLRHYYVTKQMRRIQNAEIVRQMVGHKRLNTTQKYIHLLAGTSEEWIVEGTTEKERAKQLLATDFIYQLTTPDGTMLFKKAK